MTIQQVHAAGHAFVQRSCWTGFVLDVAKREIVAVNGPPGLRSTKRWRTPIESLNEAERAADDWQPGDPAVAGGS